MYPATNLVHFVDPVQDITIPDVKQVLVTRTYGSDEAVGHIADVRKKPYFDGYTMWYTTDGGDYVQGAPINAPYPIGLPVIGIVNDDLFVWGTLSDRPFGTGTPFVRLQGVLRSDRQTLGGVEYSSRSCHVQTWVKAAPWADRLLPSITDGIGSAANKLALAAQLFRKRQALAEIINQMVMRELDEDLEELTENFSLPNPTFGAMVSASAFIPTGTRLEGDALNPGRALADRAGDGSVVSTAYSRVNVSFMYPGDASNRADVRGFAVNSLSRHAAKVLNAEGICISDTTMSPALRGLSF